MCFFYFYVSNIDLGLAGCLNSLFKTLSYMSVRSACIETCHMSVHKLVEIDRYQTDSCGAINKLFMVCDCCRVGDFFDTLKSLDIGVAELPPTLLLSGYIPLNNFVLIPPMDLVHSQS